MTYISIPLRRQVKERAQSRCEYCRFPELVSIFPHEVDHVVATKHKGETTLENLALSCFNCNRHKGSDLSSIDSETGQITPLFNPRVDV
jgi:5-methylcytosine-specific restriction endonuclease McrA